MIILETLDPLNVKLLASVLSCFHKIDIFTHSVALIVYIVFNNEITLQTEKVAQYLINGSYQLP